MEFAQATALILIEAVAIGAVLAGAFYVFNAGIRKSERNECAKWQAEAGEYAGYYIAGWQAEQCAQYGVSIPAPVVK